MTTTELLHHRSYTLRRVVHAVDAGATLPWDADLAAAFGDRATLLVALHDHWSRQLLSRIDVALELGAGTPQQSVSVAWRSLVRDQPGVRRVLDAESADPAIRAARRSLFASVAVAAGLATFDDPAAMRAATGERFLAAADVETTALRTPSLLVRVLRRLWDGGPEPDPYPWAA
jgi:hypothetical protein